MNTTLKNITKEDWRQLGYYYDRDDNNKKWILIGSPSGLSTLILFLKKYSKNISNQKKGEHDHLGPYSHLKIMTWEESGIYKDSINGTLDDFSRLAGIITEVAKESNIGKTIKIGTKYTTNIEYEIQIDVKEYGFDPALCDKQLWEN
jgi:hypothetical protein